eukprot:TRINITY_DN7700_c0_g2_i1.p1 TRINITY_DN7700_c0_g2~~TRINITY_DN7700_c0_g2_i1.p1  ORF type:complete len:299 (+),score=72.10 TRINITY_DN7700_c0_g2_i1:66-962(+)
MCIRDRDISLWFIIKAIVFGWLAVKFYQLFIREWLFIAFYWKQGLKLDFWRPIFGSAFQEMMDERKHGDCAHFQKEIVRKDPKKKAIMSNIFGRAYLIILDHNLIEQFYKKETTHYEKDPLFTYNFKRVMANGILFVSSDRWRLHRRVLSNAFEFSNIKKMQPIIAEAIFDHFDEMEREGRLSKVHIMDEFQKITGDIVLKSFFGSDFSKRTLFGKPMTKFLALFIEAVSLQMIRNPLSLIFGPQILNYNLTANDRLVTRDLEALRSLAREVINQRRKESNSAYSKGEDRSDLLDFIL